MIDLSLARSNVHSQFGEDGILEALFAAKGIGPGYFCEFGAWDGKHLSNTFALYEKGWLGCYIEGVPERVADLKRNVSRPGMHLVNAFVGTEGENSLDTILLGRLPANGMDLLSIDIDSDDLAIWQSLELRPRVVVIEYNPTIPFDVRYKNPPGMNRGNSALSIWEHGVSKDYELVAMTETNLVMVDAAFNVGTFKVFDLRDAAPVPASRFFFGYDGTLMQANLADGSTDDREFFRVPWSNSIFPQPLPKAFRKFDEGSARNKLAGGLSLLSGAIRRPVAALRMLTARG